MTPLTKFVKKWAEKFVDRFYEGPDPPDRLRDMVVSFANDHPRASRGEWVDFAAFLAEEAYKSGFTRGLEREERTWDWRPEFPPEVLMDLYDPEQAWKAEDRGIVLREAGAFVPEDPRTEDEILREQTNEIFLTSARGR